MHKEIRDLGWDIHDQVASKSWKFENFKQSHDFVGKVAGLAEVQNHHPDIRYGWGYVKLKVTTHDAGALTQKDVALIQAIEDVTR